MLLFRLVVIEGYNYIPTKKFPSRNSSFSYRSCINGQDDFLEGLFSYASRQPCPSN